MGQASSASVASAADDPEGMTHKCDGCSDGAPCGTCGGNISRTSPAYQALDWGMMQAASDGTTDPFWKATTVAQALRDAPGRTDSADWNAIQSLVSQVQELSTPSANGTSAWMGLMGGGIGSGILADVVYPWGKDYRTHQLVIPGHYDGRPLCCPELIYPKDFRAWSNDSRWQAGVEFTGLATYKERYPCQCSCCKLRQRVVLIATTWCGGVPRDGTPTKVRGAEPEEMGAIDCFWLVVNKKLLPGNPNKYIDVPGSPDKPFGLSKLKSIFPEDTYEIIGPFCHGDAAWPERRTPPSDWRYYDNWAMRDAYVVEPRGIKGICEHSWTDAPQFPIGEDCHFKMFGLFIAEVYDICRNGMVKAIGVFTFNMEGYRGRNGKFLAPNKIPGSSPIVTVTGVELVGGKQPTVRKLR